MGQAVRRLIVALACALAVLVCLPPFPLRLAATSIAVDQTGTGGTSTSYSATVVGAGSANILFVCTENSGTEPSSISYGGSGLTKVDVQNYSAQNIDAAIWMLVTPPTGSNTMSVTGGTGYFASVWVSYSGVDTGTAPTAHMNANNASTGNALTLTGTVGTANSWFVGCFEKNGGVGLTAGTGTTIRKVDTSNMNGGLADSGGPLSTGSQSIGVTDSGSIAGAGAIFAPSGGGGGGGCTTPPQLTLLGVSGKCGD